MGRTLIRNKDVAPNAAIETDKCTDVGQDNKFLTPVQKAALTDGGSADSMHWHSGFGAISAQFGRNGLVLMGQYIEANGIPSNVCGVPMANAGKVLSVAAVVGTV